MGVRLEGAETCIFWNAGSVAPKQSRSLADWLAIAEFEGFGWLEMLANYLIFTGAQGRNRTTDTVIFSLMGGIFSTFLLFPQTCLPSRQYCTQCHIMFL
jgi:hypothetical protein